MTTGMGPSQGEVTLEASLLMGWEDLLHYSQVEHGEA